MGIADPALSGPSPQQRQADPHPFECSRRDDVVFDRNRICRDAALRRKAKHGLVFKARAGDTLATLYNKLYRGGPMPPFGDVQAMNPGPIRPGTLVVFPEPPGGWP